MKNKNLLESNARHQNNILIESIRERLMGFFLSILLLLLRLWLLLLVLLLPLPF